MKRKALTLACALACNFLGATITANPAFSESPRIVINPNIMPENNPILRDSVELLPLILRPDLVVHAKNPGTAPYPGQGFCASNAGKTVVAFRIKNVGNKNASATHATVKFAGDSAIRQVSVPPLAIGQTKTFFVAMPQNAPQNSMVGFAIKADAYNAQIEHSENNKTNAQCMMVVQASGGNRS